MGGCASFHLFESMASQAVRLLPAKDYTLRVKAVGQPPEKVGLNEHVDVRK